MTRTSDEIAQAHKACLDGANTINSVIATHNKGKDATDTDFAYNLTHDEKKARVARSVGYLNRWAKQGFLSLISQLTVEKGNPLSHKDIGLETLTDKIIEVLCQNKINELSALVRQIDIFQIAKNDYVQKLSTSLQTDETLKNIEDSEAG